jgi:hypothetical protein
VTIKELVDCLRRHRDGTSEAYTYPLCKGELRLILDEIDCLSAMVHDLRSESDAYQQGLKDGRAEWEHLMATTATIGTKIWEEILPTHQIDATPTPHAFWQTPAYLLEAGSLTLANDSRETWTVANSGSSPLERDLQKLREDVDKLRKDAER